MLEDLRARAAVGPAALPSCAFLTFVNTHQALHCAAISPDATSVAGEPPLPPATGRTAVTPSPPFDPDTNGGSDPVRLTKDGPLFK